MTSIDIHTPLKTRAFPSLVGAERAGLERLGRFWAIVTKVLNAMVGPRELLRLNDRRLRDLGIARVSLEYEVMIWPLRRRKSGRDEF